MAIEIFRSRILELGLYMEMACQLKADIIGWLGIDMPYRDLRN